MQSVEQFLLKIVAASWVQDFERRKEESEMKCLFWRIEKNSGGGIPLWRVGGVAAI
jgi:hypothetical protein